MRTGLTKQEKTTDIWFDEKDPLIHIDCLIQHTRWQQSICYPTGLAQSLL